MQRTVYSGGGGRAAEHLSIDRDDALHRAAGRLLRGAQRALKDCSSHLSQHRRDRAADIQPPTIDLSDTWTLLDTAVVAPLEEVQQRVSLSVDIVRDVYEAQVEMLSGPAAGADTGSSGAGTGVGAGTGAGASTGGLIGQLQRIHLKQKAIDERMKAIAANLEDEVGVCAGIMAFSSYKARGLTTGEREFGAELSRCTNVVARLDAAVQSLDKMQVQCTVCTVHCVYRTVQGW
jgi:hypothetical protein